MPTKKPPRGWNRDGWLSGAMRNATLLLANRLAFHMKADFAVRIGRDY